MSDQKFGDRRGTCPECGGTFPREGRGSHRRVYCGVACGLAAGARYAAERAERNKIDRAAARAAAPPRVAWYAGREEEIRGMIEAGASTAVIAASVPGCPSRSAVIGLAHRRGWEFVVRRGDEFRKRRPAPPRAPRGTLPPADPPAADVPNMSLSLSAPLPASTSPLFGGAPPLVESLLTPFCDLTPATCRWMDGSPSHDAPCCGRGTEGSHAFFCSEHEAAAYVGQLRRTAVSGRYLTRRR